MAAPDDGDARLATLPAAGNRDRRAIAEFLTLNPTPREPLLDAKGRPDFLWDEATTLEEIRELLPRIERYHGKSKPFWEWVLAMWPEAVRGRA